MPTRRPVPRSSFATLSCLTFSSSASQASRSVGAAPPSSPERYAFPTLLKISASRRDLGHGSAAHAAALKRGFDSDPYISSSMVSMYSKCGALCDAVKLFDESSHRDATAWNSMIDGYLRHGCATSGFSCFLRMQLSGVRPDGHSLSIVLSGAGDFFQLELGRQAHAHLIRTISDPDAFLVTALIDMYLKCGRSSPAVRVFDSLNQEENLPSVWNAMIGGFWQMGLWERSFEFYAEMKRRGVVAGPPTYSSLLAACSHGGAPDLVETIHGDVIKVGLEGEPYVCTSLLSIYGRCGAMDSAYKIFAGAAEKRTELCNVMIAACAANGRVGEAIRVFGDMDRSGGGGSRPDSFTIANAIAACSSSVELQGLGRAFHGQAVKVPAGCSVSVSTSLVTMYGRLGRMEESSAIFEAVEEKDAALRGSMVAGLCQNKELHSAISLVNQMLHLGSKLDSATLTSIASAAAKSKQDELGFQIHGHAVKIGLEADTFVGSALVDVYARSGLLESAGKMFAGVKDKNLVAWNSIISGYGRSGDVARCAAALTEMRLAGLRPDSISITAALVATSSAAALLAGKMIHAFQMRNRIPGDSQVGNSLIEMYVRCGSPGYARKTFDSMPHRTIASWNSMISGYGSHGLCDMAMNLFEEMKKTAAAPPPDGITFLALISACSHRGFTGEGIEFFKLMTSGYQIEPTVQHYAAMVDLLGRAGQLEEAFRLAGDSPIAGGERVWLSLISASRLLGNVEAGEAAACRLSKFEAEDHVQMWKLYGEAGMPEKAAVERRRMKTQGLKKKPGCSWIELGGQVEVFFSGDSSSPRIGDIHGVMCSLRQILEEEEEAFKEEEEVTM